MVFSTHPCRCSLRPSTSSPSWPFGPPSQAAAASRLPSSSHSGEGQQAQGEAQSDEARAKARHCFDARFGDDDILRLPAAKGESRCAQPLSLPTGHPLSPCATTCGPPSGHDHFARPRICVHAQHVCWLRFADREMPTDAQSVCSQIEMSPAPRCLSSDRADLLRVPVVACTSLFLQGWALHLQSGR